MKTWVAAVLLLATACREPVIERVDPGKYTPPPATATGSPVPVATPSLRAQKPTPSCVNGWREPAHGTARRDEPLDRLAASQGFDKPFHVVDLRYFTDQKGMAWWYGHVIYTGEPEFLIRFLATRARLVAVADYGTTGFHAPDWYGFGSATGKNTYPGLPGKWPGKPYDYVAAGELPPEVRGCLT